MKRIKGILFDKDGTLMDFHSNWVRIGTQMVDRLLEDLGLDNDRGVKADLLDSIGLHENEVVPDGILASGTTKDISEAFICVLQGKHVGPERLDRLHDWLTDELYRLTKENREFLTPTTDLSLLLEQLRRHGLKIGIATADDLESTHFFLDKIGIRSYFDFIGTSDHYDKKPNAGMFHAFCGIAGLRTEEVAVAGDTVVDLLFARNGSAGLAIGVLSGVSGASDLKELADHVIGSVGDIVSENGRLIWQNE